MIDGGKDRRKGKNMSFVNDLKNTITPAAVHDWDGTESPYRYVTNSNG